MAGIWLGFNPLRLSGTAYVEMQQNAIRAMNVSMPVLGAVCIVLTLAHAYLVRDHRAKMAVLVAAAVLFIVAGIVTRFGNQPINAIVMGWRSSAPPSEWMALRNRWWQFHIVRTIAMIAGFCCVIRATISSQPVP